MKWTLLAPVTAAVFLAASLSACNRNSDGLAGRPAPKLEPGSATAAAAAGEGAFVAPKGASNFNLAPVSKASANILLPKDQMITLDAICLSDISAGLNRLRAPVVRMAVGSQMVAAQSTTEPMPDGRGAVPGPFANWICKPNSRGLSPDTLPANVILRKVLVGRQEVITAFVTKDQKIAQSLTLACMDKAKLDTADAVLQNDSDVDAPNLVLGSGSKILVMTKLPSADKSAEFILITCEAL